MARFPSCFASCRRGATRRTSQCKTCKFTGTRTRESVSLCYRQMRDEEELSMGTSEGISKCLECGHIDESTNFPISATESSLRVCPQCHAGESALLHELTHYVSPSGSGDLPGVQYTLVNNEFGHYAVADRATGTRLSTWGSHAHAMDDFYATEDKVRRLSEREPRGQSHDRRGSRVRERRSIPRAGVDRRLLKFSHAWRAPSP